MCRRDEHNDELGSVQAKDHKGNEDFVEEGNVVTVGVVEGTADVVVLGEVFEVYFFKDFRWVGHEENDQTEEDLEEESVDGIVILDGVHGFVDDEADEPLDGDVAEVDVFRILFGDDVDGLDDEEEKGEGPG